MRAALAMSPFTIMQLIAGFVRSKTGAILLGPQELGVYGQGMTGVMLAVSIGTLCVGAGLTQRITEARVEDDNQRISEAVSTALFLCIGLTLAIEAAASLLSARVTTAMFGGFLSPSLTIVLALGLVPASVSSGVLNPLLFGTLGYRAYSWAKAAASLISMVAFVCFSAKWGINGAIWSITVSGVADLAAMIIAARPYWRLVKVRLRWPRMMVFTDLAKFGAANFGSAMALYWAAATARATLLGSATPVDAGFYHVSVAVGGYWTVFFSNGVWAALHPAMSGQARHRQHELLTEGLTSVISNAGLAALAIIFLRAVLLRVLYTRDFAPAAPFVAVQALGDFGMLLNLIFGIYYLAQDRKIEYVTWQALPNLAVLVVGVPLAARAYPLAIPVSYAVSHLIALMFQSWRERIPRVTVLRASEIAVPAVAVAIVSAVWGALIVTSLAVWMAVFRPRVARA